MRDVVGEFLNLRSCSSHDRKLYNYEEVEEIPADSDMYPKKTKRSKGTHTSHVEELKEGWAKHELFRLKNILKSFFSCVLGAAHK